MSVPVAITFHGMLSSPAVEVAVARWVSRLEHVYDRIQRCHVWIDLPHRHQRLGARFLLGVIAASVAAQLAILQLAAVQNVFALGAVSALDLVGCFVAGLVPVTVIELVKLVRAAPR